MRKNWELDYKTTTALCNVFLYKNNQLWANNHDFWAEFAIYSKYLYTEIQVPIPFLATHMNIMLMCYSSPEHQYCLHGEHGKAGAIVQKAKGEVQRCEIQRGQWVQFKHGQIYCPCLRYLLFFHEVSTTSRQVNLCFCPFLCKHCLL